MNRLVIYLILTLASPLVASDLVSSIHFFPVASRTDGLAGTRWFTSVQIANPQSEALTMALMIMPTIGAACDNVIRIAPETLNLRSDGTVVTVHTDILYSDMDVYTVYLAGVVISSWKADNRGYFVAKFQMDDIKAIDGLILNDYNTFQLVAVTVGGEPVCGETDVMVIDRGSARATGNRKSSSAE
jgi:hypothetical protein